MGGYGSGRWGWHSKATTVEDCRTLDVNRWMREGIIVPDTRRLGIWAWTNSTTGEQTASIGYEVDMRGPGAWVRLRYTVTPRGGELESYNYRIPLAATFPHFGGRRWWFVCPLSKGDQVCGRRVGKIYMPPGGRYYGCRHCYELTYTSAQEHDPRVSRLANDPMALYAALRAALDDAGGDTQAAIPDLLLALKAAEVRDRRRSRSSR